MEIFTGNDETIEFEDVLGADEASPLHLEVVFLSSSLVQQNNQPPPLQPHVAMERKLGIQAPRMI